jgi:hypothetical protein
MPLVQDQAVTAFNEFLKAKATKRPSAGVIEPKGMMEPSFLMHSSYYDVSGVRIRSLYTMNFRILREMARKTTIIAAIQNTRLSQLRPFTEVSHVDDKPGYKIRLRDAEKKPSKKQKEEMAEIEKFFERTGFTDFKDAEKRKDRFPQFVEKLIREQMTIDQNTVTLQQDRSGRLIAFHTLDGSTIHPVSDSKPYQGNPDIRYVQRVQGRVVETFKDHEMLFHFMNHRADLVNNAFGYSYLEQAIDTITGWLFGMAYNKEVFNSSAQPKGFFSFNPKQPIDPESLQELQRQWIAMFRGIKGMWKVPFLQYDAKWNPVRPSNADMEYNNYIQLLSALICAVHKIDPGELGLKFNQSSQISIGGRGAGDAVQAAVSHDRGLRDLLTYTRDICNRIMERQQGWEDYEMSFTGVEVEDKSKALDDDGKRVKTYQTLNELRKEKDMDPLEHGDIVLDPTWVQYLTQKEMMAEQGGVEPGMEGGEMGGAEAPGADLGEALAGMTGSETEGAIQEGMDEVGLKSLAALQRQTLRMQQRQLMKSRRDRQKKDDDTVTIRMDV